MSELCYVMLRGHVKYCKGKGAADSVEGIGSAVAVLALSPQPRHACASHAGEQQRPRGCAGGGGCVARPGARLPPRTRPCPACLRLTVGLGDCAGCAHLWPPVWRRVAGLQLARGVDRLGREACLPCLTRRDASALVGPSAPRRPPKKLRCASTNPGRFRKPWRTWRPSSCTRLLLAIGRTRCATSPLRSRPGRRCEGPARRLSGRRPRRRQPRGTVPPREAPRAATSPGAAARPPSRRSLLHRR